MAENQTVLYPDDVEPEIRVDEVSTGALADYARISIAFEVRAVLEVAPTSADGFTTSERRVSAPYRKDYDAHLEERPTEWPRRFDVAHWGFFLAREGTHPVGGAAVAFDTPGVEMLEGRRDLAVLWDLRVAPEARGRGVGAALFRAVERWAIARGCSELKVETQDVNVPACRFYARRGCTLSGVHRGAYAEHPGETQLLWRKELP